MKRILALAATMTGLLAIPTAAMASTTGPGWSGPGSGYGSGSGSGSTISAQPYTCYYGFHRVHHHPQRYFDWWQRGRQYSAVTCPFPRKVPLPNQTLPNQTLTNQCQPQTLTFSVAAGSSDMTEVSGPQLSPAEQFTYGGTTYTVMSVNPGADQFTAFANNYLYTNNGGDITDATAALCCSSS